MKLRAQIPLCLYTFTGVAQAEKRTGGTAGIMRVLKCQQTRHFSEKYRRPYDYFLLGRNCQEIKIIESTSETLERAFLACDAEKLRPSVADTFSPAAVSCVEASPRVASGGKRVERLPLISRGSRARPNRNLPQIPSLPEKPPRTRQ